MGGDAILECLSQDITLTEETVTTTLSGDDEYSAQLSINEIPCYSYLDVVFDGNEHRCFIVTDTGLTYGALWDSTLNNDDGGYDWSQCPFWISADDGIIYTETAGTYTVKIIAPQGVECPSDCLFNYVTQTVPQIIGETPIIRISYSDAWGDWNVVDGHNFDIVDVHNAALSEELVYAYLSNPVYPRTMESSGLFTVYWDQNNLSLACDVIYRSGNKLYSDSLLLNDDNTVTVNSSYYVQLTQAV